MINFNAVLTCDVPGCHRAAEVHMIMQQTRSIVPYVDIEALPTGWRTEVSQPSEITRYICPLHSGKEP